MAKDLTSSRIDRQNILNNDLAIQEVQHSSNIKGILFEGKVCLTKSMVATFFGVESRTIERYVSDNADELMQNGYEILRGQRLKTFIKCVQEQNVPDINVGNISNRTPQLALFPFSSICPLTSFRLSASGPTFFTFQKILYGGGQFVISILHRTSKL